MSGKTNRVKTAINRAIELIEFGFEDAFISLRTGLKEQQVYYLRSLVTSLQGEGEE